MEKTFQRLLSLQKSQVQRHEASLDVSLATETGESEEVVCFNSKIQAWRDVTQAERAARVLEEMAAAGVAPTLRSYKLVISSWGHAGNPEQAALCLDTMQQAGIKPDQTAFNLVIDAWARNGKAAQAEQCLMEMQQVGVVPDASCFTSVIGAWQEERDATRAQATLAELMRVAGDSCCHQDVLIGYNLVIAAWGDLKKPDMAEAMLEQLLKLGGAAWLNENVDGKANEEVLDPGFRTLPFNLLINAWGLTKQAEKAEAVLQRMQEIGVEPDALSYQCAIYSWQGAKEPERAEQVLQTMCKVGIQPDADAFNRVIQVWGHSKDPERAEKVLALMEAAGVPPDLSTFNRLITAWGQAKKPKRAEAMLERMEELDLTPNTFCYNSLIDAWRDAKRPQDAEAVIDKMQAAGMPIDGSSFNRVIRAWGDTKQPHRAQDCLAKMRTFDLAPDQFCYNSVINAWADAKNPERAEAMLREALHFKLPLEDFHFHRVQKAWEGLRKYDRSAALAQLMSDAGITRSSEPRVKPGQGNRLVKRNSSHHGSARRSEQRKGGIHAERSSQEHGHSDAGSALRSSMDSTDSTATTATAATTSSAVSGSVDCAREKTGRCRESQPQSESTESPLSLGNASARAWGMRAVKKASAPFSPPGGASSRCLHMASSTRESSVTSSDDLCNPSKFDTAEEAQEEEERMEGRGAAHLGETRAARHGEARAAHHVVETLCERAGDLQVFITEPRARRECVAFWRRMWSELSPHGGVSNSCFVEVTSWPDRDGFTVRSQGEQSEAPAGDTNPVSRRALRRICTTPWNTVWVDCTRGSYVTRPHSTSATIDDLSDEDLHALWAQALGTLNAYTPTGAFTEIRMYPGQHASAQGHADADGYDGCGMRLEVFVERRWFDAQWNTSTSLATQESGEGRTREDAKRAADEASSSTSCEQETSRRRGGSHSCASGSTTDASSEGFFDQKGLQPVAFKKRSSSTENAASPHVPGGHAVTALDDPFVM